VAEGNSFLLTNDYGIDFAEDIVETAPCAKKVSFHISGFEATLYAARLYQPLDFLKAFAK